MRDNISKFPFVEEETSWIKLDNVTWRTFKSTPEGWVFFGADRNKIYEITLKNESFFSSSKSLKPNCMNKSFGDSLRNAVSFFTHSTLKTHSIEVDTRHILYHLEFENINDVNKRVGYISIYSLGHLRKDFDLIKWISESEIIKELKMKFWNFRDALPETLKIVDLHPIPESHSEEVFFFLTTVTGVWIYFNLGTTNID